MIILLLLSTTHLAQFPPDSHLELIEEGKVLFALNQPRRVQVWRTESLFKMIIILYSYTINN